MKTLRFFLLLLLMPLFSKAASPSFNSFLTEQFTNNGIKIGLNTNYVLTWQQVNTNYLTTNGYSLTVNTGALAAAIGGGGTIDSNNIAVPPPNQGVLYNSNGVLRSANGFVFNQSTTNVGIGVSSPTMTLEVGAGAGTVFPQIVATNPATGAYSYVGVSGTIGALGSYSPANAAFAFIEGTEAFLTLNSSASPADARWMRVANRSGRTILESLSDAGSILRTPFTITNTAPTDSFVIGADGIIRIGTGLGFGSTRQFTAATNAVRVFAGTGTTVTITNNTGNGSLDYRIDATGSGSQTPITQDVDYAGFSATNMGTLGVSNLNVGTLVASNLFILNNPSEGYIYGLPVTWTATNELVVGSGSAWIESETNAVKFTGATVPVTGLTATRWAYVYLQYTNGVASIVVVTNAPNAPFYGTARSQLGATTRRFLCPIRTDDGGGVRPFDYAPDSGEFTWTKDYTETLVLNAGTATSSTLVNASNAVPPISTRFIGNTLNSATSGNVAYGSGDFTVANTPGSRTAAINAGRFYTSPFVVNTNQQFAYLYSTGPTGGSFFVTVNSFTFSR